MKNGLKSEIALRLKVNSNNVALVEQTTEYEITNQNLLDIIARKIDPEDQEGLLDWVEENLEPTAVSDPLVLTGLDLESSMDDVPLGVQSVEIIGE